MKVVFRADASVKIGTGHVMRCLTLADKLTRQGHICHFICREHEGHLGELISGKGYKLTVLPSDSGGEKKLSSEDKNSYTNWLGAPWQIDAQQTQEAIEPLKADWLVVDHYALDARWEQQVAKAVDRIMVIDDLADRRHECELLLDQNLGRTTSDYEGLVPSDCPRLIGPEYALLRPEFPELRDLSLKRREHPELKRILISLGGVDQSNVTGKVLEAIAATALPEDILLDIIMGASAPYLDEVRRQAALLPCKATVNVSVSDMAERMYLADLSIGGAGGTSWERCCLGLPSVLVIQADNQSSGAMALEAAGAAIAIADPETVQVALPSALAQVTKPDCLHRMSRVAAGITDGKGSNRVRESIVAMTEQMQ
ncbi:UDP-2,4-diacetamido-2,4,6-trideoxy-beta-L-altropyranose hydrolase [Haliea sp. E1-2-M8]|uniref:UDP-2,4-diacetamido-2,4, 6-trideoxy-beta-L-altropyranose hydrolase n=1 Tax=Haliea sp. E1-2-M8 TaxID=3064706 RepID=UPI002727DA46|nr:UDP-2,4-diacetamido-2,4,6-trideoxy-beta-L-altropyranose hydrolase [Haliea sp. E1-2-M8]MDO8861654.1 UDP-2,4-diacetamido-2,4,6-trideoxy-beta-L-altropyranose hydrolase [Haliea sp. E1-2-M8]